jgi:tetratricopeptide (TPR) repeat protein
MGSNALDIAIRSAEQQQEKEVSSKFSARMQDSKDMGNAGTLRNTILTYVSAEQYDKAIETLKEYVVTKSDYPSFGERAERYVSYAIDLMHAIKAKRSFPGLQNLPTSKQQDLYDKAMDHFEDLKATLRKVEAIEKEVKLEDIRSTVWVVKAVIYSAFALGVLGFLMEVSKGVLPAAWVLIDTTFGEMSNWLFDKLGM